MFSATVRSGKMPPSLDLLPPEGDAAGPGTQVAHDGAERGRLAGAVPAHQAHDLARRHLEGDAAEDVAGLDVDVDRRDAQHGPPASPLTLPSPPSGARVSDRG